MTIRTNVSGSVKVFAKRLAISEVMGTSASSNFVGKLGPTPLCFVKSFLLICRLSSLFGDDKVRMRRIKHFGHQE